MTIDESQYIDKVLNYSSNIDKAQQYIKEAYDMDSEFNYESGIITLHPKSINESLNVAQAKYYILNTIGEDIITVKY